MNHEDEIDEMYRARYSSKVMRLEVMQNGWVASTRGAPNICPYDDPELKELWNEGYQQYQQYRLSALNAQDAALGQLTAGPALNGTAADAPGFKADAGKPKVGLIFNANGFPRALLALAELATLATEKDYREGDWQRVENGRSRYTDAMDRHRLKEGIDPDGIDPQYGLHHDVATAWCALARLELRLREKEKAK